MSNSKCRSLGASAIAIAVLIVFGAVGPTTAFAQDNGRNSGRPRGGWVVPCSLDGVNPAYHPEIFGNPAVARSYGFARSRYGGWEVMPGCRRF